MTWFGMPDSGRVCLLNVSKAFVIFAASCLICRVADAQKATGTPLELMKTLVIPQSDIVFAVGRAAPKDDKDWAVVMRAADRLEEAAKNLSDQAPAGNNAAWVKFAQLMRDAANRAGSAARTKNVDATLDAGDALYETCEGCHKQYLKK